MTLFKLRSRRASTSRLVCPSRLLAPQCSDRVWIWIDPAEDSKYDVQTGLINRRGIYKDVYRSGPGREWSDYQFRPNFPIAMTVAPEMFDAEHALGALRLADEVLRGPLGMKTLDPIDLQYRPYYDNSNDGDDASIAKGLNYHQVSLPKIITHSAILTCCL